MKSNRLKQLISLAVFLMFVISACGNSGASAATPTASPVPATSTRTAVPTSTPLPTKTPNLAATEQMNATLERVQSYVEAGYLPNMDGRAYQLDDYSREFARINTLDVDFAGYKGPLKDFAVWANVKWQSAGPVSSPEYSGCGFSFRINQDNFDGYTAMLTNERVLLTYCDSSSLRCGEIGKTSGSGRLKKEDPAEAFMELIVNDLRAYVLVDGEFIGEYSLLQDKLTDPGYLLYSIISGTNKDYGVRCEINNASLWVP